MDDKYLPLLAMSAGLLGQGQQGQRPTFASSLGQGLLGGLQGMQMMQQVGDDKRRQRLQELRFALENTRMEKEAAQEAARAQRETAQKSYMEQYGQGLSPEQRAEFNLMPDKFLAAKIEQQFAAPEAPEIQTFYEGGNAVQKAFNPQTGGWDVMGSGPRFAPQQGPSPLEAERLALQREEFEWKRQNGGGSPSPLARLIAERDALPEGDERRTMYDAAIAKDVSRGGGIALDMGPEGKLEGLTIGADPGAGGPGKAPAGYRWSSDGTALEKIPGGPADVVSADMAGKVAAVEGSRKQLGEVEEYFFPGSKLGEENALKGGTFNRTGAAKVSAPLPSILGGGTPSFGGGAQAAQINGMIDTMIRLRTGAGLNAQEPAYYREMYLPSAIDTEGTAREKLRQLRTALEEANDVFNRGRKTETAPGPTMEAAGALKPPAIGEVKDGYRFKGGDPASPDSWEPTQ